MSPRRAEAPGDGPAAPVPPGREDPLPLRCKGPGARRHRRSLRDHPGRCRLCLWSKDRAPRR